MEEDILPTRGLQALSHSTLIFLRVAGPERPLRKTQQPLDFNGPCREKQVPSDSFLDQSPRGHQWHCQGRLILPPEIGVKRGRTTSRKQLTMTGNSAQLLVVAIRLMVCFPQMFTHFGENQTLK